MNNVTITVDSTSDFPKELAQEKGVIVVNQSIYMGGKTYTDNVDISPENILDYVMKTGEFPKTSCPSCQQYIDTWTPLVKKGHVVIHFNLSSELGGNYQNASLSAKEFNGSVYVIDSKTATMGIILLVLHAIDLLESGISVEDVYSKILEQRENVHLSIMLENLKYMRKSGRCNAIQSLATGFLKIRIELRLINGQLKIAGKYRGSVPQAIAKMIRKINPLLSTADKGYLLLGQIGHDNPNMKTVYQHIEQYQFKNVYHIFAGSTITCHIGDGGIGIAFLKA